MSNASPPNEGDGRIAGQTNPATNTAGTNPYQAPDVAPSSPPQVRWQFSLPGALTIVVVIVLTCVLNVGLGILLAGVVLPAYVMAVRNSSVQLASGETVAGIDRFISFAGSILVVLSCAAAGFLAFFVTCTGSALALDGIAVTRSEEIATMAASCVAIVVIVWRYWISWPRMKAKASTRETDQ